MLDSSLVCLVDVLKPGRRSSLNDSRWISMIRHHSSTKQKNSLLMIGPLSALSGSILLIIHKIARHGTTVQVELIMIWTSKENHKER